MKEKLTLHKIILAVLLVMIGFIGWRAFPVHAGVDEIRIADSKGDWGYPNPFRHYPRGPGYVRMSWVFDTLVWKDKNGFIPALARSWAYDAGENAFVFDLRKGVSWHDGRPFTAEDVVFTLNYYKKHSYSWVPMEPVAGAEALGPHKVQVRLKRPYAPFMTYVGGTMPILPKHIWEEVETPKNFQGPKAYIGTGPYRFVDFDKVKGTYLYEAFEDYYQGAPKAKRLIYVKTGKSLISLSTGKVDLANIKPDMAPTLEKKGMVLLKNDRGWNKKLMINHRIAPFNDKRFRQALAYALDQQEIIDKAHRGYGEPASFGLLSPDHEYFNPHTPTYAHDPEKARRILESLGYRKDAEGFYSKDGKPLRVELLSSNITVAGESVPDRDGEVMKHQFESVGIRTDLLNMEQATTDGRVRKWEFQLAISGHGGLLGDAVVLQRMVDPRQSGGSINSARFDGNKELLELLEKQAVEMDTEKRRAMVHQCQEIYAEELPAIPLYYPDSLSAYNPKKGIEWYYTRGGLAIGIPISQNKMSLVSGEE